MVKKRQKPPKKKREDGGCKQEMKRRKACGSWWHPRTSGIVLGRFHVVADRPLWAPAPPSQSPPLLRPSLRRTSTINRNSVSGSLAHAWAISRQTSLRGSNAVVGNSGSALTGCQFRSKIRRIIGNGKRPINTSMECLRQKRYKNDRRDSVATMLAR